MDHDAHTLVLGVVIGATGAMYYLDMRRMLANILASRRAIRALRKRLSEELDHVVGHRKQGDQKAATEHQPANLLGLGLGGKHVDEQAHEGNKRRDDEGNGHAPSIGGGRGVPE